MHQRWWTVLQAMATAVNETVRTSPPCPPLSGSFPAQPTYNNYHYNNLGQQHQQHQPPGYHQHLYLHPTHQVPMTSEAETWRHSSWQGSHATAPMITPTTTPMPSTSTTARTTTLPIITPTPTKDPRVVTFQPEKVSETSPRYQRLSGPLQPSEL